MNARAACLVPCDDDCTAACHEDHLPTFKREGCRACSVESMTFLEFCRAIRPLIRANPARATRLFGLLAVAALCVLALLAQLAWMLWRLA